MTTFSTPTPIDLAITLTVGSIEILASDRADTVVTVSPTNPGKTADVRAAEETNVEFDGGRIVVRGPRPRFAIIGPNESIEVRVELPTGSRVTADTYGFVRTSGRLGATRLKASHVRLDAVADLWVRALHGNVEVKRIDGSAEITADHGRVRLGTVTGDASVKASHGAVTVGESGGDLDARLSYGDLEIRSALGSVTAKTAYGTVVIEEVSSGSIHLETGYGEITVGVRPGVPAWLDIASKNGRVRNALVADAAPSSGEQTVAVRARTQYGEIEIRRSGAAK